MLLHKGFLFRIGEKYIPKNTIFRHIAFLFYYRTFNLLNYHTYDFFEAVEIETSTACNRRCSYCPNSIYDRGLIKNKKLMPTELFKKIVDELSALDFDGRLSPHFYGEPLLDERIVELMRYARDKLSRVRIAIFSNGEYLTLDLYKSLIKAGVNEFNVSEHGNDMSSTMSDIFRHREKYGDDGVLVNYIDIMKSDRLANRGGLLNIPPASNTSKKCLYPSETMVIDYEGNVILCCNDYLATIKFGNLSSRPLIDIWKTNKYKIIRRRVKKGILDLPICKMCKGS